MYSSCITRVSMSSDMTVDSFAWICCNHSLKWFIPAEAGCEQGCVEKKKAGRCGVSAAFGVVKERVGGGGVGG